MTIWGAGLIGAAWHGLSLHEAANVVPIDAHEAMRSGEAILIDVREPEEIAAAAPAGARRHSLSMANTSVENSTYRLFDQIVRRPRP